MAKKTKKISSVRSRSILLGSGLRAFAVVTLVITAGAVVLPAIFADSQPANITGFRAYGTNTNTFSVHLEWSGQAPGGWRTYMDGGSPQTFVQNRSNMEYDNLGCGGHTATVQSLGAQGNVRATANYSASVLCPSASLNSLTHSGNTVSASWSGNMSGATYAVVVNGNAIAGTTDTSYSFGGSCGTSYNVYIQANVGGRTGNSNSAQVATDACPAPPSTPTNSGGGSSGGSKSGGGTTTTGGSSSGGSSSAPAASSGGSGASSTKKTTTSSSAKKLAATTATPAAVPQAAPSTPGNLAANVVSSKIVKLQWDASSNADHYVVSRSIDNITWQQLDNTKDTSYTDQSSDFSTTYYYQVQAVGSDNQVSGYANTQVTTEAFKASSNTVTSQDKLVSAVIPNGAIDGTYNCTLSSDDSATAKLPSHQKIVLGPYVLLCISDNGDVISNFKKPLNVTMKLKGLTAKYSGLNAQSTDSKTWKSLKSTYKNDSQQLSFQLTSARSFAALGKQKRGAAGTIFLLLFLILLIVGAIFGYRYFRNRQAAGSYGSPYPTTPSPAAVASHPSAADAALPTPAAPAAAVPAALTAEQEFKQALAKPDCSHLGMAQQVVPSGSGCLECQRDGTHWNSLRICLICGHVGCSDDSEQQHALKHFQETGHPLIYEYGNPAGNTIGWCYIDQTYI